MNKKNNTRNPNGSGTYKRRSDGRYVWTQMVDGQTRVIYANSPDELYEKVKKIADLPIAKNKYKVDEWVQKWLEVYVKPLKKQATYDQYKTIYNSQIKPVIGNRKLSNIKPVDIQGVIAKMNENGLATKTMKHAKSIMNIALKKAEVEKIIAKNPVIDIEIPIKQAKPRKTLTTDELTRLLNSMGSSRWIWSVKFALVTGLRRGELLALKWADIDWESRRIVINKSNSKTGLGDTKNSKVHYVPISDKAIEYLDGQKKMLGAEYNPCFYNDELKKAPLVFPNESGTMIRPDSYHTMFRRFAEKAGVKASPHSLRHTFVYLMRGDLSLKDLQNILGHSESTTTLDIYGDMINDNVSKNIEQMNTVFDNLSEGIDKAKTEIKNKNVGNNVVQFRRIK